MGKRENQRVALTKRLVQESFLQLLQRKRIQQISIRELCEDAGINRTTFYNHYGSQYDVLSEISQNYLADIVQTLGSADPANRGSVHQRVRLVLQYAEEHLELSALLINNNIDETFAARLFSLPKIEDMLGAALSGVADERERNAVISFVIQGSYKLIQDWINAPARISAAEEARLVLTLAERVCYHA